MRGLKSFLYIFAGLWFAIFCFEWLGDIKKRHDNKKNSPMVRTLSAAPRFVRTLFLLGLAVVNTFLIIQWIAQRISKSAFKG
jgi:hypothetical protein